eukprot:TRINITY_DN20159_c0_g1_i1.p1 TRINITY_DN20159_c0_g1~~TRINITY_DN20159_c0_g1_i1.p1  ORF type:complete len:159 (-),score=27.70 TRINITY_DN20159_c0_g1_i1:2-478(-)
MIEFAKGTGRYWKRITTLTESKIICIQTGSKWLKQNKTYLKAVALDCEEAAKFRVKIDEVHSTGGFLLVPLTTDDVEMEGKILFDEVLGYAEIRERKKFCGLWNFVVPTAVTDYKGLLVAFNVNAKNIQKYMWMFKDFACVKDNEDQYHRFVLWELVV